VTPGSPPRPQRSRRSQENLELHARAVAAVRAREVPLEILAPGFWMENRAFSVTDYTYRGAAGWRDWMNDIFEEFTGRARYELERTLAATDDFVIACFCIVGRSARSGARLMLCWTGVTWFRDGKLICTVGYATSDEALEAAKHRPQSRGSLSVTRELCCVSTGPARARGFRA
jgi:hypothetical protein